MSDDQDAGFALPQCLDCRHFHPDFAWTCDAFPGGIPRDIFDGARHDEPREGDHGIQFEPRDETERTP